MGGLRWWPWTGSPGPESAAGEELPKARAVMDPFHVVSLAGDKLDECRRRIQRAITGRRGRAGDRLYRARRTLLTGAGLLTDAQAERLEALFADDRHAAVQAAWGVYQRLIQAYRVEDPGLGKYLMQRLIDSLRQAVPDGLEEIQTLARTLISRSQDVLAHYRPPPYLQRPHRSGGRTPRAPGRHRLGIHKPHQLHHPQPHPHRTPQRPPDSNHLNPTINLTHHTLKHEEPPNRSIKLAHHTRKCEEPDSGTPAFLYKRPESSNSRREIVLNPPPCKCYRQQCEEWKTVHDKKRPYASCAEI